MAFGEVCWAATEFSGGAGAEDEQRGHQRQHCATRGEVDALGQTSHEDKMQRNDVTIKQSRRDKMRQGAQYNDKARQDVTTRGCDDATTRRLDDNETRGTMRDATQRSNVAWRRDEMGNDDKGQRDDATTTNKQSGCDVWRKRGKR
jgi:hypothetical protein